MHFLFSIIEPLRFTRCDTRSSHTGIRCMILAAADSPSRGTPGPNARARQA